MIYQYLGKGIEEWGKSGGLSDSFLRLGLRSWIQYLCSYSRIYLTLLNLICHQLEDKPLLYVSIK